MTIVLFVGDTCSGKSTILQRWEKEGFTVLYEEGWSTIPTKIEENKVESNKWFCHYYAERDQRAVGKKLVFMERCLQYQYPFTEAQRKAGKITAEQREEVLHLLQELTSRKKLPSETIILHFQCSSTLISERLIQRGIPTHARQQQYWDILREETKKYFQEYHYYSVDTAGKSVEEVGTEVKEMLKMSNIQSREIKIRP